jgi:alcohol dehydrogenase (cytochrome c)
MKKRIIGGLAATLLAGIAGAQTAPVYTTVQAERGRTSYTTSCAACHGPDLGGGQFGPPLRGVNFRQRWAGVPVAELFEQVRTMPPGQARSLNDSVYADLVALMLAENGVAAGSADLPSDLTRLTAMNMPGTRAPGPVRAAAGGGLTPGAKLPFWPARRNPLDSITPVTDALLTAPPDGSWLQWRRTWDAKAFSPLNQINKGNVKNLGVAWSLALPAGPNAATP